MIYRDKEYVYIWCLSQDPVKYPLTTNTYKLHKIKSLSVFDISIPIVELPDLNIYFHGWNQTAQSRDVPYKWVNNILIVVITLLQDVLFLDSTQIILHNMFSVLLFHYRRIFSKSMKLEPRTCFLLTFTQFWLGVYIWAYVYIYIYMSLKTATSQSLTIVSSFLFVLELSWLDALLMSFLHYASSCLL